MGDKEGGGRRRREVEKRQGRRGEEEEKRRKEGKEEVNREELYIWTRGKQGCYDQREPICQVLP